MNNPIIYVIIPIFNSSKYLRKCLDSIVIQNYQRLKIICVNDGSTDDSQTILEYYKNQYDCITLINTKNNGVSSARNTALDLINYEEDSYITFIDSDDYIDNDYFDTLIQMLMRYSVDIVCTSFKYLYDGYSACYKNVVKEGIYNSLDATKLLLRDETIQSHSVSKLYKTALWKNVRYDEKLFYMEDQDIIYKVFYHSKNIYISNYAGYYYRQNNIPYIKQKPMDNNMVISGIKGYYGACRYSFSDADRDYLMPSIHNALVNAYLMLFPYFDKKTANKEDCSFMNEIRGYIHKNKLILKYEPVDRRGRIKKYFYLILPLLYPCIFKIGKRINRNKNGRKKNTCYL